METELQSEHQPRRRVISLDEPGKRLEQHAIEILYQVGEALDGGLSVEGILEHLAMLAIRATGAERCGVFLSDKGGGRLVPMAGAVQDGDRALLGRRFRETEPIDVSVDAPWEIFASHPGPLIFDDPQNSPLIPDSWKAWNSKAIALAVIRARGARFGILAVDYVHSPHLFSGYEERLLDAIASAAGIALHAASAAEREARALELRGHILKCAAAMQAGQSLSTILELVVDGFTTLLKAPHVRLFLVDESREVLRVAAGRGLPLASGDIPMTELPAEGVRYVKHTWERNVRRPIIIPEIRDLTDWSHLVPTDMDSALLMPLPQNEELIGLVVIGRDGHVYDEEDLAAARALADQAAAAVSYARVNEERQARLRLIEAAYGVSDLVVGAIDFGSLLARLNEWTLDRAGIECLRVSFIDSGLTELVGLDPPTEQEESMVREWRRRRFSKVTAPVLAPAREGDRVALPIVVDKRVAGIFWIGAPNRLREDELALVRVIATGIGEAAFKLKLRHAVERRSQELAISAERERIARDLHDTVGQAFYGIGLRLEDLLGNVQDGWLIEQLSELRALASGGVAEVRSAVYALSFLHVRARGFIPSIRAIARQFTRTTDVPVVVRIDKTLPKVSEDTQSAIFRTVHEALVNVDRHARATGVMVSLTRRGGDLLLTVQDDGVGIDQRQARDWRSAAHFGLRTMAKCIEEVGGKFEARAAHPRGLMIRAIVPVRDPVP